MVPTASFHIVKPCNMKCKFCYATFDDMRVHEQLPLVDAITIVEKLKAAGLQKLTFAGGEPLLYKHLYEIVSYSKEIGLTTSIISNGSLMTGQWLDKFRPHLDWVGISIDTMDAKTAEKIGRTAKGFDVPQDYSILLYDIKKRGYKLKINTVVNSYNKHEDLNELIEWASPARWKVFQALRVKGQNDEQFGEMKITKEEFSEYIVRHIRQKMMVPENNEAMTGSYLLISPLGELFENSDSEHYYSKPLQNNNIEDCLKELNINEEMFIKRGGVYNW